MNLSKAWFCMPIRVGGEFHFHIGMRKTRTHC